MKTQAAQSWGHPVDKETDAALKLTQHFINKGFTLHQARLLAVWSDPRITAICSQMESMTILRENVAAAASNQTLSQQDFYQSNETGHATASAHCEGCARISESHYKENR